MEVLSSISQLLESVSGLIEWLVTTLQEFGLPLPLWLFRTVIAVVFLLAGIYLLSKCKTGKQQWPLYAIGAIVAFVIPVSVVITWLGISSPIRDVNLALLQQAKREQQNSLALLPYEMTERQSHLFETDLQRGISTYLEFAKIKYEHQRIDIVLLPKEIFVRQPQHLDSAWLRQIGDEINALSVIGIMEDTKSQNIRASLSITPRTDIFDPHAEIIEEASYTDAEFHKKLNRRWGRATALAIATRELKLGIETQDPKVLGSAREYFVSVRSTLDGDSEALADKLKSVIDNIDEVSDDASP